MNLSPPRAVSCSEYRGRLPGGASSPPRVMVEDADGVSTLAALKFRMPAQGHHCGPTSLACELICSLLARQAGLLVPDPLTVEVSEEFVSMLSQDGGVDDATKAEFAANIGMNFGSIITPGDVFVAGKRASRRLRRGLEDVLAYDVLILNGDRGIQKTNLLERSGDRVVLLDHALALIVHHTQKLRPFPVRIRDIPVDASIVPVILVKTHLAYGYLKGVSRPYNRPMRSLAKSGGYRGAVLQSWIPEEWETTEGDLDLISEFLEGRLQEDVMSGLSATIRGLVT